MAQQRLQQNSAFYRSRLENRKDSIEEKDLTVHLKRADHHHAPNVAVLIENDLIERSVEAKWFGRLSAPSLSLASVQPNQDRSLYKDEDVDAHRKVNAHGIGGDGMGLDGETAPLSNKKKLNKLLSGWGIKPANQQSMREFPLQKPGQRLEKTHQRENQDHDQGENVAAAYQERDVAKEKGSLGAKIKSLQSQHGIEENAGKAQESEETNIPLCNLLKAWNM